MFWRRRLPTGPGSGTGPHFSSNPLIVDPEQVLAARLKCDLDSGLTPAPVAVVEGGELLGRCAEIREQSAHRLRALNAYLRAERCAVICAMACAARPRQSTKFTHIYCGAGEARAAPSAYGSADSLVASYSDNLVGVVAEPLAGCERGT
jgi:hypothetical protein